jgi:hypothetical protein
VKKSADVIVWPNPSESHANLTIDAYEDDVVTLTIFDLTGKMLYNVQSPILAGSTTIPLEIDALPSGFYVVHVMGENLREEVKFRKL